MTLRAIGLLLLATILVGATVLSPSGPPFAVADPPSLISDTLRDRVHREGRVRLLVKLRLPRGHLPEGNLGAVAVTAQRADIASSQSEIVTRLARRAHRILHRYRTVPFIAVEATPDSLAELEAAVLHVEEVFEDRLNAPSLNESVPLIEGTQAWADGYDGAGTVVAILDTGVDRNHPYFAGRIVAEACYSTTGAGTSTTLCPNGSDVQIGTGAATPCTFGLCWHGTHVAGIAAGGGTPYTGVARGAGIMPVQVFSRFDSTTFCGGSVPCILAYDSDVIAGLERVYALRSTHNFAAANLSLGGNLSSTYCDGEPHKAIIDNLRSVGIATVIAAGNQSSSTAINAPGCISTAVSVGSTSKSDVISSFSNVAPILSLLAPGGAIVSTMPGGTIAGANGTSMATPHVTGAFAILKQFAPLASVTQKLDALQQSGLPIADLRAGTGTVRPRIRIVEALAALGATPVPTISSLAPASVGAGNPSFTLSVTGANFLMSSVVRWNGAARPTTFVDVSRLDAVIPASDLTTGGASQITVANSGGSVSTSVAFTVTNPIPTVNSLVPVTTTAGGPAFTLTVDGANFVSSAVVRWNGADRATSFVTSSRLQAAITSGDIANSGVASVTVFNGAPGGVNSGPLMFTVSAPAGGGGPTVLAGFWRFEEGSGSLAADSSGHGNVGALHNAPDWTTGRVGGALQFNGTQDVSIPDSPSLSITGPGLTLAAWIYPTAGKRGALLHKDLHFSLVRRANGSLTYADSAKWNYTTGNPGQTPLNAWSHVAVTFDGKTVRFYVDGQLVGSRSRRGSLTDNSSPLLLGSDAGTSSRFVGKLDEARVYSRALTAQEITALYAGGP